MGENKARAFNRRRFLKTTAAASLGTAATASLGTAITGAWMAPAAAAEPAPIPPHGAELRGMDLVTQSPTTEGRFGFMFKNQPPHPASEDMLARLGATMLEQPDVGGTSTLNAQNDRFNENPNPKLTSGFTFVGQFIDHDITFDTTPLDQQQSDPDATSNFRTPRYDLDAIYGGGPNVAPQMYKSNDRDKFNIVETSYPVIKGLVVTEPTTDYTPTKSHVVYDVPRNEAGKPIDPISGKSTIADPRNDQTLIILQLHVAMQKFHNNLVDYMRKQFVPRAAVFESARRLARWHYQWMVIHDFLPAIVGQTMADSVYKEVQNKAPVINLKYYKPTNPAGRSFIPVEFAVAAYRFGHSITRPRYTVQDVETTAGVKPVSSVPLFEAEPTDNNLNGSRRVPARLKIQWSKFFNAPDATTLTARPVRQFDASLANPLFTLPSSVQPDTTSSSRLAERNLSRGRKMGLPSGQQVAWLMGVKPLSNAELSQTHRLEVEIVNNVVKVLSDKYVVNPDIERELVENAAAWGGEAPLWFYILKEAEIVGGSRQLGPVGGRIVAEVLVGLLQKDTNSYLYLQPAWKPARPIAQVNGRFTMTDLLSYAGVWS